jgi:hypothetical protein
MLIQLKKFGTVLTSRQAGKEAFFAFLPYFDKLKEQEEIKIDFQGIIAFSPSWGDEFLSPLVLKYKNQIKLENIDNPSVKATLSLLKDITWNH